MYHLIWLMNLFGKDMYIQVQWHGIIEKDEDFEIFVESTQILFITPSKDQPRQKIENNIARNENQWRFVENSRFQSKSLLFTLTFLAASHMASQF